MSNNAAETPARPHRTARLKGRDPKGENPFHPRTSPELAFSRGLRLVVRRRSTGFRVQRARFQNCQTGAQANTTRGK